jgi:HEAT repeat protein
MAKISKTNRASLIKDLKSNDETVVLNAIEKVKKGGDVSYMLELLDALTATTEPGIESSISQLLFDLKDKEAIEELVNQLVNPAYEDIRVIMLSACWQSGIDTSHRLPDFVTVVSTGSYIECLEVLTIIENWEDFSNQETLDLELLRLKSLLSESDKPENDEMVFSIIEVLELFIVQ